MGHQQQRTVHHSLDWCCPSLFCYLPRPLVPFGNVGQYSTVPSIDPSIDPFIRADFCLSRKASLELPVLLGFIILRDEYFLELIVWSLLDLRPVTAADRVVNHPQHPRNNKLVAHHRRILPRLVLLLLLLLLLLLETTKLILHYDHHRIILMIIRMIIRI